MSAGSHGRSNPKLSGTSVLSFPSKQAPELCGPSALSVDALFKYRHLGGFAAEVPLGLNKRRHLGRLFKNGTWQLFNTVQLPGHTLSEGRYLSFLNDVCKLPAPHKATLGCYEKEAVTTVQRAGCRLHQAHLDVSTTYRRSSAGSHYHRGDGPICAHVYNTNTDASSRLLTFDANQHELVERQRAVVGHNLGRLHAAQVDLAEVLFTGQTCQGHVGQV